MMLTKHDLMWLLLFAAASLLPRYTYAECHVISGPSMTLNYDYQRDRVPGSPDPIAVVQFETMLTCDNEEGESASPRLVMNDGTDYITTSTPNMGEVNLLQGGNDSVGFIWRNIIDGDEKRIAKNSYPVIERSLSNSGNAIRVQDSFNFYYVSGLLTPGRNIAPKPINVSYRDKDGVLPLYTLEFPPIPLFARSCLLNTSDMAIDYENVRASDLRMPDQDPLPKLVRSRDIELVCDPGTNVGFRVTPSKQQVGNIMIISDTLESSAKGVGVKMRYSDMARNQHEVRFGETLHWGRTPERGNDLSHNMNIPLYFYLVKTAPEVSPGRFEATATLEMKYE
ncbi:fimbrial protein [Aeromonas dhakensis]|uniref:fimbrial protein n=1 Tax=Aeromonas dhakensis TaxID=196024 RepID=UPI0038D0224F